jgi:hypothetical protein
MKMSRYGVKIITISIVVIAMGILMVNFDSIFTDLNCNALAISDSPKADLTQIPNSINFLDEDKTAFVNYCKDIYGSSLPLEVDSTVYKYYGTVNGYRFYRLMPTYISYDSISQQEVIGGYTFESSSLYRPERTGLYIIGDEKVYSLKQAYDNNLIDISKAYQLFIAKSDN